MCSYNWWITYKSLYSLIINNQKVECFTVALLLSFSGFKIPLFSLSYHKHRSLIGLLLSLIHNSSHLWKKRDFCVTQRELQLVIFHAIDETLNLERKYVSKGGERMRRWESRRDGRTERRRGYRWTAFNRDCTHFTVFALMDSGGTLGCQLVCLEKRSIKRPFGPGNFKSLCSSSAPSGPSQRSAGH